MTTEQLSDFEIRIQKTQHGYNVMGSYNGFTSSQVISDFSELESVITQIRDELTHHE